VAVSTDLQIVGIKDALRALNNIDKTARRDLTKRYKEVVADVVRAIAVAMPKDAPLSGFKRSWDPSSGRAVAESTFRRDIVAGLEAQARRQSGANQILPYAFKTNQVTAGVSGKKPRRHSAGFMTHLATFYIRTNNKSAELFDMAGKAGGNTAQGKRMIGALTARFGKPSRVMWPTYEKHKGDVEDSVRRIVDDLMQRVNSELR
jgi:hypothetical protein